MIFGFLHLYTHTVYENYVESYNKFLVLNYIVLVSAASRKDTNCHLNRVCKIKREKFGVFGRFSYLLE